MLSGLAEKHCDTCTCGDAAGEGPLFVVEDEYGARYSRMDFAGVFFEATSEDRSRVGAEFR